MNKLAKALFWTLAPGFAITKGRFPRRAAMTLAVWAPCRLALLAVVLWSAIAGHWFAAVVAGVTLVLLGIASSLLNRWLMKKAAAGQ